MTTNSDADGTSGPSHKAMTHGLIESAVPGNRAGLADAFGQAGAWLASGKAPPPALAQWLSVRLEAVANVLLDPHVKKDLEGQLARSLGVVDVGRPGRKAETELKISLKCLIAWECYYERKKSKDCTWEKIFNDVVERLASAGVHVSASVVEKAWKKRKLLDPSIPELNP